MRCFWALMIGLCLGCGASAPSSPEGTVREFSEALRNGSYDEAYSLMSSSYRQRVPLQEFRRYLEDHPEQALEVAAMLAKPEGPIERTATIELGPGELMQRCEALDISRAREELGFKPEFSVEEGIQQYAEWMKKVMAKGKT